MKTSLLHVLPSLWSVVQAYISQTLSEGILLGGYDTLPWIKQLTLKPFLKEFLFKPMDFILMLSVGISVTANKVAYILRLGQWVLKAFQDPNWDLLMLCSSKIIFLEKYSQYILVVFNLY